MTTNPAVSTRPCPQCGANMQVYKEYVTWCPRCNYNLEGDDKKPDLNRIEALYASLGQRQSKAIFDQLAKTPEMRSSMSISRVALFLMAVLVHLVSVGLALVGLGLITNYWNLWLYNDIRTFLLVLVVGALFLYAAWTARPRWNAEPKGYKLSSKQAPATYALVNKVARLLNAQVDQVVFNGEFNASFLETGWRRRKTLVIGLPLWEILNDQERAALIGHEVAHAVNGDPLRGFITGTAIHALAMWYFLLLPPLRGGQWGLSEKLTSTLGQILAEGVLLILRGMLIVAHRDNQRAEYLADRLGATVAGREASISGLDKSIYSQAYQQSVRRCALGVQNVDLYHDLRETIASTPESEVLRLQRLQQRDLTSLDTSHPPTALRVQMLHAVRGLSPRVLADQMHMREIDAELAAIHTPIQADIVKDYCYLLGG